MGWIPAFAGMTVTSPVDLVSRESGFLTDSHLRDDEGVCVSLVFVYGTLMRGGCRSAALSAEQFLGVARTQPHYRLYNCGEYPGLVEADPGREIAGEVWQVSPACLVRLDEVEGVSDGLYARREIRLQAPFASRHVEAYLYLPDVSSFRDAGHRWVND